MPREHRLKTWPEPFVAQIEGRKSYEIRRDDRGFAVGDTLLLEEWDPSPFPGSSMQVGYTGRTVRRVITYKTEGGAWGLPAHLCVLSTWPLAIGEEQRLNASVRVGET